MVRVVGLEPTLLAEPDFESGASTNSTTPAWRPVYRRARVLAHTGPLSKGKPAARTPTGVMSDLAWLAGSRER